MSGVIHSIGKVFSTVWDFIRPVVEVVAAAAAVYFTVGLALGAMPATAGIAASMPGFAGAAGPGTGLFTSAASALGETSIAGAGADAAAAADSASIAAAGDAYASGALANGTAITADAGAAAVPAAGTAVGATVPGATAAQIGTVATDLSPTAAGAVPAAATAGTSLTDKLLLASVGAQTISGLTKPSPTDIAQAQATFYGSFYGTNADGSGQPEPNLYVGPQKEATPSAGQLTPGINAPAQQNTTNYVQGASGSAQQGAPSLIPINYGTPQPVSQPNVQVGQPSAQVGSATAGAQAPRLIPSAPTAPATTAQPTKPVTG